jgi:hypothetical protein
MSPVLASWLVFGWAAPSILPQEKDLFVADMRLLMFVIHTEQVIIRMRHE